LPGDNAETLAARVLTEEHRLYPQALALLASGRIRIEGDQVKTSS
jgi:phosphoribosylglycinamide formyltransferase-1